MSLKLNETNVVLRRGGSSAACAAVPASQRTLSEEGHHIKESWYGREGDTERCQHYTIVKNVSHVMM